MTPTEPANPAADDQRPEGDEGTGPDEADLHGESPDDGAVEDSDDDQRFDAG